ncbi:MAG: hypothetical protein WCG25_05090 [bacterium]
MIYSINIGNNEINIIPITTFSKLFFTIGICQKKYHIKVIPTTRTNQPIILYDINVR